MSQLFLFSEPLPGTHLGLVDSSLSLNLREKPSQISRAKGFPLYSAQPSISCSSQHVPHSESSCRFMHRLSSDSLLPKTLLLGAWNGTQHSTAAHCMSATWGMHADLRSLRWIV